ncbi:unnamed protein product [Haemonchus placei]|uniref:Transcriptional regulator n=1 Tax=Haemonchus placei TaxID=6290 RepID=A0A0N4VXB0_HAEPC|nr:unnamed protein product [Haemonchus placei]
MKSLAGLLRQAGTQYSFRTIEYVLTAEHSLVPVSQLVEKYKIGADHHRIRLVQSNITHSGPLDSSCEMSFTPLRIAVVTCRDTFSETVLPIVPMAEYGSSTNHVQVSVSRMI